MNDLENCGLLELPVLCKTPPQIAEFLSGKMFVLATAAAARQQVVHISRRAHNPHFSLQLWALAH